MKVNILIVQSDYQLVTRQVARKF